MSNVSEKGPAFLLRIKLANFDSFMRFNALRYGRISYETFPLGHEAKRRG